MKYLLAFCLLIISCLAAAQKKFSKNHLQLLAGTSFNGTGDIRGFAYNTEYGRSFKKKVSWYAGIGGTIHDKVQPIFFTNQSGELIDASVRATTAGFQVEGLLAYSFIKTEEHDFLVRIGPLFRYQSTSYWDALGVFPPAGTGLPFPVVSFINISSQRTFAFGGTGQIGYNFTINNKISLGVLAGLQTDTNGDTITQLSLSIGRRF